MGLWAHIRTLPYSCPRCTELEKTIGVGVGFSGAWYGSQKEHWMGWLSEYDAPGAYGRETKVLRDACYSYNRIQCAPMLFWLAEALRAPESQLDKAFNAVLKAPCNGASQCAALRKFLPWQMVEELLIGRDVTLRQRLKLELWAFF